MTIFSNLIRNGFNIGSRQLYCTIKLRDAFRTKILNINCFKQMTKQFSTAIEQEQKIVDILKAKLLENKTKNLLVFSSKSSGSIVLNLAGVFVSFMLLGISYNTFLIFDSVKFKNRKIEDDGSFTNGIFKIIGSEKFKYSLCSIVGLLGIGCFVASMLFSMRTVNRLYLLKGGNSIGVITDGLFGKTMAYELNLNDVNFTSTRLKRTSLVSFKSNKHYFYFLLNNIDGEFHEKQVFDHLICSQR
jgi:hypothetical protein